MELNNISINRLVPIYLMSSYLYYELDKNDLTDSQFDYLCKKILDNWDNINHMHKHLIDKDKHVIFMSTCSVYGAQNEILDENSQ